MKKIENEFKFINTPKFNYKYRNEVNVLGRKMIHIGEGVFMFEKPFTSDELDLDQFVEKLGDYKDILFIRFYTYTYDEEEERRRAFFDDDMDKKKWIIPFAISTTHKRHTVYAIYDYAREYMAGFNIPASMKGVIDHIVEDYLKRENAYCGHVEMYYNKDVYDYRPADDECTHLLDFEHNTDDGRYVFVNGFVGRKVLDGIYYFDDSVPLSDYNRRYLSRDSIMERLCSNDLNPGDFKENIAFIGRQIWSGGSLSVYQGSSLYYMAFGDSAIEVLRKLYKNLSGYESGFMDKDAVKVRNEPVDLMAYFDECEKRESRRRSIPIPEGARELIEGMGFHNLDIRCTLLFQDMKENFNKSYDTFKKYEVAYILGEKLYLINFNTFREKEEGYVLSLQIIKELAVKYKTKLFDDVEEDIVQVAIDNSNAEKSILGEEDYNYYLKFVRQELDID